MGEMNFANNDSAVFGAIAEATAAPAAEIKLPKRKKHKEYTAEEKRQYIKSMTTSGRGGLKLPRLNIAITPENLDYVKTMGRVSGDGATAFVNLMIAQHMEEHEELYKHAKAFQKALEEG